MIESWREVAPTPGSPIILPDMGDNFAIHMYHLQIIKENTFDGRSKIDPHKHVMDFITHCSMFSYGAGSEEGVRLRLFPMSLTGIAKDWLDELDEGSISTWEELRARFVERFFPPPLVTKLVRKIRGFEQGDEETVTEAWERIKGMVRACYGGNLSKEEVVTIFYHGLNKKSQYFLGFVSRGWFISNSPDQRYKLLQDLTIAEIEETYLDEFGKFDRKIEIEKKPFEPTKSNEIEAEKDILGLITSIVDTSIRQKK